MKKPIGFILSFLLLVLLIVSCTNLADLRNANNANLENLSLSEGTLSPVFNATTTSYTVTVPYATTSLTVTGTKADATATMTPVDGKLSVTDLSVGETILSLKVTAQDKRTHKTYKVKVLRQSNDATLSGLVPSTGTLSPAFNAATTSYTITVPYATTSLTVTGTKADANATMDPVDGKLEFTGLSVGTSDEKTIKVTSQDGSATKEYKVKVLRQYIEMVPVPAGRFQRDSNADNISVITKAYSLSKYQITRQQFKDIMGTDPSSTSYSTGMSDPVQQVNWYHAIAFCNKLSIKEGLTPAYTVSGVSDWANLAFSSIPTTSNATWNAAECDFNANGYRLPTEMEWMWAAMGAPADGQNGGTNTTGYLKAFAGQGYGAGMSIDDYAWYTSNSSSKTHPVGEKLPNELGLYDMSGNVWEWCGDWYGTYPTGTITDYTGSPSGSNRVIRGGGWGSNASLCTVAVRGGNYPYYRYGIYGFRILRPVL